MTGLLAQATVQTPQIPWGAISPELVLFGAGILVLLLETAGRDRLPASVVAFLVLAGAGGGGIALAGATQPAIAIGGLVILAGVAQLALVVLWRHRPRVLSAILAALGLVATLGVTGWQWLTISDGGLLSVASVLGDMVAVDGVALFTRVIVCVSALLSIPLGWAYLEQRRIHRGEYYPLLLFAATGMNLLASSADLIMVFISIEILSLSLYILCGFAKRDLSSQEAAFKYFLLGAFSSAVLLYGVALCYGLAGTTNIAAVGSAVASLEAPSTLSVAAMGFLLVGFGFKTALVPFHMWTPDVYQGAPTPVTGFMAAATKAAAFAAFVRVFVVGFWALACSWIPVIWTLAVITMLVGAVLAVVQTDLKRMLGYSAVAHAGYVLIGLVSANRSGISGTLFYLLVYAVMSVGSFGVLALLERRGGKLVALDDLRGLGRSAPVPAALFALFLLSLAGIPGTAGFMAKFAVFRAGLQAGQTVLVVVAVISSMIAAFFYVRVIVAMFMDEAPEGVAVESDGELVSVGVRTGLVLAGLAVVLLGVVPDIVVKLAQRAATLAG
ncbi:MAG: NADH-quinone oxidoreductase subunit N [Egibacteraceae bacterium]